MTNVDKCERCGCLRGGKEILFTNGYRSWQSVFLCGLCYEKLQKFMNNEL